MNDTYYLTLPLGAVRHYPLAPRILGDYARPTDPQVDVSVRSGDYFITLATMLEAIAADLPQMSLAANSQALMKLAQELDYLQQHYRIVKKDRPDQLTELH